MPGPKFFQTRMGVRFFEADLPRLIDALEKIGKEMSQQNELKKQEQTRCPVESKRDLELIHEYYKLGGNQLPPCSSCDQFGAMVPLNALKVETSKDPVAHWCQFCGYIVEEE